MADRSPAGAEAPSPSWPGIENGSMIKKVGTFFQEVRAEMQKVTWSTREELIGSTAVVLVTMLILSTFIGITDFIFSQTLHIILR